MRFSATPPPPYTSSDIVTNRSTSMRPLKTCIVCSAVLIAMVGLFAQEGPVKDPGNTVARPKKPADPNAAAPEDPNLPQIPSQYKKEKQDLGNIPNFKLDVD